ncbi:MAG: energy transducer TonB [Candidatus Accumulibacter sp. UW26]|jgi:protein TonB
MPSLSGCRQPAERSRDSFRLGVAVAFSLALHATLFLLGAGSAAVDEAGGRLAAPAEGNSSPVFGVLNLAGDGRAGAAAREFSPATSPPSLPSPASVVPDKAQEKPPPERREAAAQPSTSATSLPSTTPSPSSPSSPSLPSTASATSATSPSSRAAAVQTARATEVGGQASTGEDAARLARHAGYALAGLLDVPPMPLADILPDYPEAAGNQQGSVVLRLFISDRGEVDELLLVRAMPSGFFEEAALTAFAQARFSPGMRNGRAVKSQLAVEVEFVPFNRGSGVTGRGY